MAVPTGSTIVRPLVCRSVEEKKVALFASHWVGHWILVVNVTARLSFFSCSVVKYPAKNEFPHVADGGAPTPPMLSWKIDYVFPISGEPSIRMEARGSRLLDFPSSVLVSSSQTYLRLKRKKCIGEKKLPSSLWKLLPVEGTSPGNEVFCGKANSKGSSFWTNWEVKV